MEWLEKTYTLAYRQCSRCKQWKPIGKFHRAGPGKRQSQCAECRANYQQLYRETRNGYEASKRYEHSPKGQETRAKSRARLIPIWLASHPYYVRSKYHKKQDEAGCHWEIRSFYPAFRFLKALGNAEIVEGEKV